MMEVILRPHAGGKTTEMINRAARSGLQILTYDSRRADAIRRQAEQMGVNILRPMSVLKYIRAVEDCRLQKRARLLIDDADAVLEELIPGQIEAITMTDWSSTERSFTPYLDLEG